MYKYDHYKIRWDLLPSECDNPWSVIDMGDDHVDPVTDIRMRRCMVMTAFDDGHHIRCRWTPSGMSLYALTWSVYDIPVWFLKATTPVFSPVELVETSYYNGPNGDVTGNNWGLKRYDHVMRQVRKIGQAFFSFPSLMMELREEVFERN